MPSAFAQDFADSAGPALLDLHGEEVVYTPDGGTPRTIKALVDRSPSVPLPELGARSGNLNHFAIVTVLNQQAAVGDDGYGGILDTELQRQRDTIDLAERTGGETNPHIISKILSTQAGMLRLEVR